LVKKSAHSLSMPVFNETAAASAMVFVKWCPLKTKSAGAPIRALRGFTRVPVGAGETQHVSFTLEARDLSLVNESGDRIVAAGAYSISVGGGQPGTGAPAADAPFSIRGEQKLPE
jgi:beta-glucosidase